MFEHFAFRTKILSVPAVAAVAFLALIFSNVAFGQLNALRLDDIQNGYFPALQMRRNLEQRMATIQRGLQDAVAAAEPSALEVVDELRDEFFEELEASQSNQILDSNELSALSKQFEEYYELARTTSVALIQQATAEDDDDAAALNLSDSLGEMVERYQSIRDVLASATANETARMSEAFEQARTMSTVSTGANLVLAALSLLIILASTLWISRSVIRTLGEVSSFVASASAEILAVAEQTETNATDEAAFVDETRHTMEGLLEAANEIAASARGVLDKSERSVEASRTIAERINRLNGQALKISDVSETIRAIADKSDILALNASLEGSKAGEAGRGFTLVGAEMRRLAETVGDAVLRIKQLAHEIRELSQAAVLATEQGEKLASETTQTSKQITLITNQQMTATEQVSSSMAEIHAFTQQSIAGAKQAKSAADDLVRSAEQMKILIQGRNSGVDGVGKTRRPASGAAT